MAERNRHSRRCGVAQWPLAAVMFAMMFPAVAQQFTVAITSPAKGATFAPGSSITIDASATSPNPIVSVEFFRGSVRVGDVDTTAPYSTTWSNVPAGQYSLTAKATDSKGRKRTSSPVNISVNANQAPTVNAGPDQTITLPSTVTLTGSASDDGLPNPPAAMTYAWTSVSGPGTVTFNAPNSLSTTASFSAYGSYVLQLTASDGALSASDTVSITVGAATDPRATTGEWSPIAMWPDVAVHMHLLPDGKVLSYSDDDHHDYHTKGTRAAGSTRAFIVTIPIGANPSLATWWEAPNTRTNLFCSGHSYLPDGRLLIMGGHDGADYLGSKNTTIFDYRQTSPWDYTNPDMSAARWYPTAVTLANGEVLVLSGSETATSFVQLPEVWRTNSGGGWRALSTALGPMPLYPYVHLAPNGSVFWAGPATNTFYLNTAGTGSWQYFRTRVLQITRYYGSSVMYEPGKILVMGGGDPPTATAEVIDLNASAPAWRTVGSMSVARRQINATILADGTVLVTGGTSSAGFNSGEGAQKSAELWNPATEQWTTLASMEAPRLYHSAAILLQDGRVLSAGGGRPAATGTVDQENAEIFSPPYLFKGMRPTISSAPTGPVAYGEAFFVGTPDAASIAQVTLVRLSSATHGLNMNQRFNRLTFVAATDGLNAVAPPGSNVAPPGHYLLFVINSDGVPSVARTIQIL